MESPAAESRELVSDPKSFLKALARLHQNNDAILFWNVDDTFRILLRNDPVETDSYTFDLSILCDDDASEGWLQKLLQTDHDGYFEEDGVFTFETISVSTESDGSSDDTKHAMEQVNALWRYRVCPCKKYLIKDAEHICTFCEMTMTEADTVEEFCPICHDTAIRKHMIQQACCSQFMHNACLETWVSKTSDVPARCPMCRGV